MGGRRGRRRGPGRADRLKWSSRASCLGTHVYKGYNVSSTHSLSCNYTDAESRVWTHLSAPPPAQPGQGGWRRKGPARLLLGSDRFGIVSAEYVCASFHS